MVDFHDIARKVLTVQSNIGQEQAPATMAELQSQKRPVCVWCGQKLSPGSQVLADALEGLLNVIDRPEWSQDKVDACDLARIALEQFGDPK
jgi:hypothetical protein